MEFVELRPISDLVGACCARYGRKSNHVDGAASSNSQSPRVQSLRFAPRVKKIKENYLEMLTGSQRHSCFYLTNPKRLRGQSMRRLHVRVRNHEQLTSTSSPQQVTNPMRVRSPRCGELPASQQGIQVRHTWQPRQQCHQRQLGHSCLLLESSRRVVDTKLLHAQGSPELDKEKTARRQGRRQYLGAGGLAIRLEYLSAPLKS